MLVLLDYLVTSDARKQLLVVLWGQGVFGTVREVARLAHVAPSAAVKELTRMENLGIIQSDRRGNARLVRANPASPYGRVLKQLLATNAASATSEQEAERAKVRDWLASYGAPLVTTETAERNVRKVPSLERVLARALRLSHGDASLTRTLPVVLWRNRLQLDLDALIHETFQANETQTLGFLLELTDILAGEEVFGPALDVLRDKRYRREVFYFREDEDSPLSRELAQARTPEVARRWKFLMNMPFDSFESMFRKASAHDGDVQLSPARPILEGDRSGTSGPGRAHRDRRRRRGTAVRRKA